MAQGVRSILFVAEANSLAHVVRPLVLAKSLNPHDYDIHFACAPGFEFVLEDTGFTFHSIQSMSVQEFIDRLAVGGRLYNYERLSSYIREDRALIRRVKPDLVIGDFRLSLSVSAPAENVGYLAICNAHWSPFAKQQFPIPEHPLVDIFGPRVGQVLFNIGRPVAFRHHLAPLNRHRRENHLPKFASLGAAYTQGDATLFCDVPGLVPTKGLPDTHHYIGPIVWSPDMPLPDWWHQIEDDRPTIYVTLGSTGQATILPDLIASVAQLQVNLVIATAGRRELQTLPDRVYCEEYLPGIEAAKRSALVICNGGSATAYQAISQGTPVLGIASNMDQFFTMGYIEKFGAGRLLRAGQANGRLIASLVREMLASTILNQKAQALADEFSRYRAIDRFPEIISQWN
ncbi:MAG: nucleotide disphospho-sugar-binding domain-containing protein [Pseudomonadota bacterium]